MGGSFYRLRRLGRLDPDPSEEDPVSFLLPSCYRVVIHAVYKGNQL
jgi:hypothetical protein